MAAWSQQQGLMLRGQLKSAGLNETTSYLTVIARTGDKIYKTLTDNEGNFQFKNLPAGTYGVFISSINFKQKELSVYLDRDKTVNISLEPALSQLDEVYVTASESKGMSSTSIIDKEAMQLLQPSSFTDLMELLPGGRSFDPNLTGMNQVRLRSVSFIDPLSPGDRRYKGNGSEDDMSSLGTAFYMDGSPINTTANMQSTDGFTLSDPNGSRNATNKGVDMRSISTDQIEKVEVVRGIPSVEYGDLTSGLIKIERKKGASPLNARMKADGFSKLAAVSKGFSIPKQSLLINADLDFLDAKQDPTDNFENYQRITASVRADKTWRSDAHTTIWSTALDYGTNIDRQKSDPDNGYAPVDNYTSRYNSYSLNNQLQLKFKKHIYLKSIDISAKANYQQDEIDLTKWIQTRSAVILANSLEEGVHDANYITPSYAGHMIVDGKPFYAFLKGMATLALPQGPVQHMIKLGVEGNYSKNFGDGQVYDLDYPLDQKGSATRPRAFKSIPAMQNAAVFAEDAVHFLVGQHHFTVAAGIRGMVLPGMDKRYRVAGKMFLDPRVNAKWDLPRITLGGKSLAIQLGGGYGLQTKLPTLDQLYPAPSYIDLIQLNFYHNNPAFRKANVMTYIIDQTNFDLNAAVNTKWELNTDIEYNGNRLSVTYFREHMSSGFRDISNYRALSYRKYDNTSLDASQLTAPPQLGDFTYQDVKEYYSYSLTGNGSALRKEGIEYQYTSPRFTGINTRFTVNGAWIRTSYSNSFPLYQAIGTDIVTSGNRIRQYLGLYDENGGNLRQQLNTNVSVDSYMPFLGLNLIVSVQSMWFNSRQGMESSGAPAQYLDIEGNVHAYTEADRSDPDLKWLDRNYNAINFLEDRVPIDLLVNLKASKSFKNKARVSMFVNRIVTYEPNYTNRLGNTFVRQGRGSPYFGMELNFSL